MNKLTILACIFIYLAIITILADSLAITITSDLTDTITVTPPTTVTGGIGVVFGFFATFWSLLSFQLDVPPLITIIFVYPPLVMVIFMVINIIRGTD